MENIITQELKEIIKEMMSEDFDKNEKMFIKIARILKVPVPKIRELAMD